MGGDDADDGPAPHPPCATAHGGLSRWERQKLAHSGLTRAIGTALLAAIACGPHVPPPDLSVDPVALLAQVQAAQEKVQRVSGRARVHIKSPRLSGSVEEFVAAEKPDRIRLETFDFFGNVAAVLVADHDRFTFYDAREKVFYRGAPTPANVSRLLPLVLPASELATIVCGSAPLLEGRAVSVTSREDQLLLTLAAGGTGQRLAVGEKASVEESLLRHTEPAPDGAAVETSPAYDLRFDRFREVNRIRFPGQLELVAPAASVEVELRWKSELEVNGPSQPELFHMDPPRHARIVDLAGDAAIPDAAPSPLGE